MKYLLIILVFFIVGSVCDGYIVNNDGWLEWNSMDQDTSQEIGVEEKEVVLLQTTVNTMPYGIKDVMEEIELKDRKIYHIGQRKDGDRLVAKGGKSQHFPTAQHVAVTLHYPRSGSGAMVTFVSCEVKQSSPLGRVYVKDGGIGKHSITFVIEADKTKYIKWACQVYGI